MTDHARLSPSSATGWMGCPAYPDVNAEYPDEDNKAACEGTAAHGISDFCMAHGFDAYDMIGTVTNITGKVRETVRQSDGKLIKTNKMVPVRYRFEWTEADADLLQPGLDWLREQEGQFFGEKRLDLQRWLGAGQFGTVDRFIVSRNALICGDLKWGRGIPVKAVGNKQTRIYTLGGWQAYAKHVTDPKFPVIINIDQPRNASGGGIWQITLGELLEFGEEVKAAAALTQQDNPPRIPGGDTCLWCKGKDDCEAFQRYNLEMLDIEDFEDLDDIDELPLPDPDRMTPERRRVILDHTPMIKKWLESVHARVFQAAISGGDTGGLKLVEGRKSADKWKDKKAAEKAVVALLGEKGINKKLITPTQAGKKISSEDWKPIFNDHVIIGTRKPTLVDVADDRPAIESFTDAGDFEDLDD